MMMPTHGFFPCQTPLKKFSLQKFELKPAVEKVGLMFGQLTYEAITNTTTTTTVTSAATYSAVGYVCVYLDVDRLPRI